MKLSKNTMKEFIESEELLDLVLQNHIGAQVAIKQSQWRHHIPLLGLSTMLKVVDIGILLVGTNGMTANQKPNVLETHRGIN
jgi:hypothetical protein